MKVVTTFTKIEFSIPKSCMTNEILKGIEEIMQTIITNHMFNHNFRDFKGGWSENRGINC